MCAEKPKPVAFIYVAYIHISIIYFITPKPVSPIPPLLFMVATPRMILGGYKCYIDPIILGRFNLYICRAATTVPELAPT